MTQYHFRNGYEEKTGNPYAVAFDVYLKYPVEVLHEGQWVSPESIPQIQAIIQQIPVKQWWDNSNRYLYTSDDHVAYLDKDVLFIAIARNPMGNHALMRRSGIDTFQWFERSSIYNMVVRQANLIDAWPEYSYNAACNSYQPNYWMLESWSSQHRGKSLFCKYDPDITRFRALPSTDMTLQPTFELQIDKQLPLYNLIGLLKSKGSLRYFQKLMYTAISENIVNRLRCSQKVYLPYVGHFKLRGTRVCFSASRLLKDRLKGKPPAPHRLKAGRIYGGETDPGQSIILWKHHYQLSKRRYFVLSMLENIPTSYSNVAVANVVFQAFTDALIFRLCQGIPVTIKGVGTLRPQAGRVYFRKSKALSLSEE